MKKFFLFILALLTLTTCQRQAKNDLAMCHDPNVRFASFADDRNFINAHPAPRPFEETLKGKMVTFSVPGGKDAQAYCVKARKKTNKYLLVFHEWWGLNEYVRKEADDWSKDLNVNVLALDLYDGKVARQPEEAGKLMQANDPKRSEAIILAAAQYAGPKADFRTIGWCFGGGWSLKGALALKDRAKGCVMYYGMPEKNADILKTLATDVLFIHASKDQWINDAVVAEFEQNMKAAGKSLSVHRYDADHAFANPSSPKHNEQAAREARSVAYAYLSKK